MVRAVQESISYMWACYLGILILCSMRLLVDTIANDLPDLKIKHLKVDGGVTQNQFILQYTADLLQREVRKGTALFVFLYVTLLQPMILR